MIFRSAMLVLPLLWGVTALAQEDDDQLAPASHKVVSHSASTTKDDDVDDLDAKKPKTPALPNSTRSAPVVKPLPGPVRQSSPPLGSEEGDDLLGPTPARKPEPAAAKAKASDKKARKERASHKATPPPPPQAAPAPALVSPASVSPASVSDDEAPSHAPVVHRAATDDSEDFVPLPKPVPVKTSKRKPAGDVPRKAAAGADAFSFDLLPEEKKGSLDEQLRVDREVSTRRSMLQWHQGLGLATAGLMVGTVITGQLNFSDKFGGNGNSGSYELWHSTFEAATVVAFLSAGALALFAPVPYVKKSSGVDSVTVHKYSMLVATIGMAAEVPLGIVTVVREGYTDQATLALIHLAIGYVTAAALGTGATALLF